MKKIRKYSSNWVFLFILLGFACSKKKSSNPAPPPPGPINIQELTLDNAFIEDVNYNAKTKPVLRVKFSQPVLQSSVGSAISITNENGI